MGERVMFWRDFPSWKPRLNARQNLWHPLGMVRASRFYRAVRQFSLTAPVWEDVIRYFTKPDERWDLTLVSQRVYGNRDEYLAVMAAAGLDRLNQELTERELVLPSLERLELIKQETGFTSTTTRSIR